MAKGFRHLPRTRAPRRTSRSARFSTRSRALQRGEDLAARKAIYERLHPSAPTKAGRPSVNGERISSFTEDTRAKTNLSQRTIQHEVQGASARRGPRGTEGDLRAAAPGGESRGRSRESAHGRQTERISVCLVLNRHRVEDGSLRPHDLARGPGRFSAARISRHGRRSMSGCTPARRRRRDGRR